MRQFGVKRASVLYWNIFLLLCIVVWLAIRTTNAKRDPQAHYKIAGRGPSMPDQILRQYLILLPLLGCTSE
ncbi:hypothetical protein [Sphingobacterium paludis]|uniref:hypothetical protein n=1 Tax=Sphingobacterium paludis TaxID=1476465 RepID=UPI00105D5B68|nr:hypothetical protein [Sphingobacterium paludis]